MKLQFSIGITSNPRTWPIIDGQIEPDAIELVPTVLHPSELFWRRLRLAEFDVAEMSVSSLMMAGSKGDACLVIQASEFKMFGHRRETHTIDLWEPLSLDPSRRAAKVTRDTVISDTRAVHAPAPVRRQAPLSLPGLG